MMGGSKLLLTALPFKKKPRAILAPFCTVQTCLDEKGHSQVALAWFFCPVSLILTGIVQVFSVSHLASIQWGWGMMLCWSQGYNLAFCVLISISGTQISGDLTKIPALTVHGQNGEHPWMNSVNLAFTI